MPKAQRIVWTGKNLAAVRALHKDVTHHPETAKSVPHYRDWTQHPDNLHVELNGATVIAEIGDALVKGADGTVSVEKSKTPRAPRALRPVPPSTGRVINVVQSAHPGKGAPDASTD